MLGQAHDGTIESYELPQLSLGPTASSVDSPRAALLGLDEVKGHFRPVCVCYSELCLCCGSSMVSRATVGLDL